MTPAELKAARLDKGLSQAALATILGVDVMTVSRWERALREIPPFLGLAMKSIPARAAPARKGPKAATTNRRR